MEVDIILPFLVSNNLLQYRHWAIHPSILKYEAMFGYLPLYTESLTVNVPLTYEGSIEDLDKRFQDQADKGYPLAKIAVETRNAYKTLGTPNLLLDEIIDRLTPAINNGNIDASYRLAIMLKGKNSYEIQKRCVEYYTKSAKYSAC